MAKQQKNGVKKASKKADDGRFYTNKYGNIYGETVHTPLCRFAFVNIAEKDTKYKPHKFRIMALFDKSNPAIQKQLQAMKDAAAELCAYYEEQHGEEPSLKHKALKDGDKKEWNGFPGHWYISAASQKQVQCFDKDLKAIDADQIVAGHIGRLAVTPLLHDTGIAWQLTGVQFVKDDGVRLGGGSDPRHVLGAYEDPDAESDEEENEEEESEEEDDDEDEDEEESDDDSDDEENEDEEEDEDSDDDEEEDEDEDEDSDEEEDEDEDDDDEDDDDEEEEKPSKKSSRKAPAKAKSAKAAKAAPKGKPSKGSKLPPPNKNGRGKAAALDLV